MTKLHVSLLVFSTIALSTSLTACSPNSTGLPHASVSTATSRGASVLGSEYCITNDSSMRVNVQWRGYPSPTDIPIGATQCNSGYQTTSSFMSDMKGVLGYEPTLYPGSYLHLYLAANNDGISSPVAGAWIRSQGREFGICHAFALGESKYFEIDWLRAEMTRLPDTVESKKFLLRITDGTNKLYTPETILCTDGDDLSRR